MTLSGDTVEDGREYPVRGNPQTFHPMTDALPKEGFSTRLAEIRGQLKLLSDYL
jgi:hypothetical protein